MRPAALLAVLLAAACEHHDPPAAGENESASAAISASAAPEPSAAPAAPCPKCASIERCSDGQCVPDCPQGEVYVPSTGKDGFTMGRGKPGASDQAHTVVLTKPFCMDATEVTVAAYRECVKADKCTEPQLRDQNSNYREEYHRDRHPLNMVNWMQATEYCAYREQALPTEAQWEWAAGHGDGRLYPWGNDEPTCESGHADFTPFGSPKTDPAGDVGCHGGGSSEVKAHAKGKSVWPGGEIYDLGGNVWEWTADCYLPYPSEKVVDPSPQEHPSLKGDCYVRSLRGGGWNRSPHALRVKERAASKRTYRVPGLGFRCVRNAK